jgi:CubicO group peptidase (beta-lactamase class C family)
MKRALILCVALLAGAAVAQSEWRASTAAEKVLDAAAFQGMDDTVAKESDVQSVVVVQRGRVVYEYYRDGSPETLREVQSVAKSALSTLAGIAIGQGRIAGLDQPVVALMPEWTALNTDPRAATITVRHLLTMTAGFAVNDPTGTGASGRPAETWARPLRNAPGQAFAYDNALIPMLAAVLEKATGMTLPDYARQHLGGPLEFAEPGYSRGLQMRTIDMAKLGQLLLQGGEWGGKQIVPASYVAAATSLQNGGGPPAGLPYGYMWWLVPSGALRPIVVASGYSGQRIWVDPQLNLVVAGTSTVSQASQARGQIVQLRGRLVAAAQRRAAADKP